MSGPRGPLEDQPFFEYLPPCTLTPEEADRLIDYVARESTIFVQGFSPPAFPLRVPPTMEMIRGAAGRGLPPMLADWLENDWRARMEFFGWIEEVVDRAVGGATGLGGPYVD